jgi:nitroreductase
MMDAESHPAKSPGNMPHAVDVLDAIRRRRFYRAFEDRPVPSEVLDRLAWAAGRAQQAWAGARHLVIVDDPVLMETARQILPGFVNNSPAMIVICTDTGRVSQALGRRDADHNSRLDSGAAAAHIALAARAFSLGACTVTSWHESAVRALLDLPDHIRPDVTVAIGYPLPGRSAASAAEYAPTLHRNRYTTPH